MRLQYKKVKEVTVTYVDGETETFYIPEDSGFYRQSLTYEEEADSKRISNALICSELNWYTKVAK